MGGVGSKDAPGELDRLLATVARVRRARHEIELVSALLVLTVLGVLGGALLVAYAVTH